MFEPSSLTPDAFAAAVESLTHHQKTLLRLAADGRSTKEMLRLGVALKEGTIDNYLSAATKALGARDRRQAGRLLAAFEDGQSQLSQLRSPDLPKPQNSGSFGGSEAKDVRLAEVREERVQFVDLARESAPPGLSSVTIWIDLVQRSPLLKIGCAVALAIGVAMTVVSVATIAGKVQEIWQRTTSN